MNNKSQGMSFETIAVIILVLTVLVLIIYFVVTQFTDLGGGLGDAGSQASDALDDAMGDALEGISPEEP